MLRATHLPWPEPCSAERVRAGRKQVAGGQVARDRVAGDRVARDRVARDRVARDRVAGDRVARGRVAGDRVAGDRVAMNRVDVIRVGDPICVQWILVSGQRTIFEARIDYAFLSFLDFPLILDDGPLADLKLGLISAALWAEV